MSDNKTISTAEIASDPSKYIVIHPHQFNPGGWGLDVQFMDIMGSPYLIAHGRGIRVANANTSIAIPSTGKWHIWVRSRKWVEGAGAFTLRINSETLTKTFGIDQSEWAWEYGGEIDLPKGTTQVSLIDKDGFDGRFAGLILSQDKITPTGALDYSLAPIEEVKADLVIVGGGIPGTSAAVAAARRGLKVAIVQDRPVLGGNGSSEIRVWSAGEARHPIVKELRGWFMNRDANMILSDAHRQRIVEDESNIETHLSTRAFGIEKSGTKITAVKAFDWKHGKVVHFSAPFFCDATGDGWIGFWAGADYRMGREAKGEYNESFAPEVADDDTLGASLMWTSAEANRDVPFSAPWAEPYAQGEVAINGEWNWEYGIHRDVIEEGEAIRDRLLLAIYGAFSLAKKNQKYSRRVLDCLPFILGKRESRRLLGDWVLSESDVTTLRQFPDAIATGSWSVDLHYDDKKEGVDFLTTCRQPHYGRYWIPYRSIYSRNIENLFMAGRCFSATHVGLAGPRVINTLSQLGVAVGEAAAICKEHTLLPRDLWTKGYIPTLQRILGGDFPGNPDPTKSNWLIIDDEDDRVIFEGEWKEKFCSCGEQVGNKVHLPKEGATKAIYPLPVKQAGRYRLMGKINYHWECQNDSSTAITIISNGESTSFNWNQAVGTGEWIELGIFSLTPGATLEIDVKSSYGTVVADGFAIIEEI